LLGHFSFAQTSDPHSLLEKGKKFYYDGKYDSAVNVLKQASYFFRQKNDYRQVLEAEYLIGENLANINKCDSAILIIDDALERCLERFGTVDSLTAKGYYYLARANGGCARKFRKAVSLLEKSKEINQNIYGEGSQVALDYNAMGNFYDFLGKQDSALYYLNKALEIWNQTDRIDSLGLSHTYAYASSALLEQGEFKKSLESARKALEIRESILIEYHPTISNSMSQMGSIYMGIGNYEQALHYLMKSLEMRKETLGKDHANVAASYYLIGDLHSRLFDYRKAIFFIEQGNLIIAEKYGEELPVLHTWYAYLGKIYGMAGEYEKAEEILTYAQKLAETVPQGNVYRGFVYRVFSEYYAEKEDIINQISYIEKSLEIYGGKSSEREASLLMSLGKANFKASLFEEASRNYNRALDIYEAREEKNISLSELYRDIGDLKSVTEKYEEALEFYLKSLNIISLDSVFDDVSVDINTLTHKPFALGVVQRISQTYRKCYQQTSDLQCLKESLRRDQLAITFIDHIFSSYQLEISKAQLEVDNRDVFEHALTNAYELYQATGDPQYKQVAFELMEKSKAPILLSKLREDEAKSIYRIPDSILEKERDIRIELSYYKEQLRKAKEKDSAVLISRYQRLVFDTRNTFESLKDQLKSDFPDYHIYKYSNEVIPLTELRKAIDHETTILEYFESDSSLYCFVVSDSDFEMIKLPISSQFPEALANYHQSLTDHHLILSEPKRADSLYVYSASYLYDVLIRPLASRISDKIKKLILISDGRLSQVNFSTFLSQQPTIDVLAYESLDYLLKDFSISYAYSATLNFNHSSVDTDFSFAGFAPSYNPLSYVNVDSMNHPMTYQLVREGELPIPGAVSEVTMISDLLGGRSWINKDASESAFKKNVDKYSIIHLAMHSLLNDQEPEYSELLFNHEEDSLNDGYLSINEIYNLDLNANMVVLSACSSGSGKISVGEGPISFSRAFSYAGCPSVIMSMWKLPDEATREIMFTFYEHIKSGNSKDEALQKAQLAYLGTTEDPLYQHPFFWGSFVVLGDTKPLKLHSSFNWYFAAFSAILGIGLLLIFRRRIRLR